MRGFPFDSQIVGYESDGMPIYDRASNAEEFARMLNSFFKDGVFGETMCEVLEAGGMSATVGVGEVLVQGRYGYVPEPETVNFAVSGAVPRIDTVVVRLDLSSGVNNILLAVVQGTPSATPVAPLLTRDGTVWEIGLADVLIPANSTAVSQPNISDTRLSPNRCGIVEAVLSDVNTEHLFNEFDSLLRDMRSAIQSVYEGVEKVNLIEHSATLLASGWSESEPYSQTVEAVGVLGADRAWVDCDLTLAITAEEMTDINDAWGSVLKAESGTDSVTVYFSDVPDVDIPIKIQVVR